MADVGLRELERRFRASGSPDDEARWLVARLRQGEVGLDRLELAACCDHAPAALALRAVGVEPSPTSWVTDVRRWGDEACVRAGLLAAARALPVWLDAFPDDARPASILDLVERWLERAGGQGELEPPPEHVVVDAEEAAYYAQLEAEDAADFAASWGAHLAEQACVAVCFAARAVQAAARDAPASLIVPDTWLRRRPARTSRARRPPAVVDDFLSATSRAARALRVSDDVVRDAVNAAFAAWCLSPASQDALAG